MSKKGGSGQSYGSAGFSSSGPKAGSFASSWQSSQGNVKSGSCFSNIQSQSMSGSQPRGSLKQSKKI
ncbi:hypothetical protein pb186bvf_011422 [Paramecium bursaria]